jgi:hypothetical protein
VRSLLLLSLTGCAQLLGLENTSFDQQDAAVDAPGICDGAPACTSSTQRSVCGQVFGTGANAGVPLRVAEPTGEKCAPSNTEGPCALAVTGSPMATYFDGTLIGQVSGQMDDCGRYVVGDLDRNAVDVAILFTDQNAVPVFNNTARLFLGRTPAAGIDRDVDALAVTLATTMDWANQMNAAAAPETTTGYLITYTLGAQTIPDIGVALDNSGAIPTATDTVPWAGYFTAANPFGTLDSAAPGTSANGTAFTVLPTGPFSLEGVRTGKRCKIANLKSVANTLIHVIEDGC